MIVDKTNIITKISRITPSGHRRQLHSMINGYLTICLGQDSVYNTYNILPYMDLRYKITGYHPESDVNYQTNPWDNYFDQPAPPGSDAVLFSEYLADGTVRPEPTDFLYRKFHYAYKKYLHVKPHILEKVDNFCREYFTEDIVGFHIRGTDSFYDTTRPHPSLAFYRDLIKEKFSHCSKIYISTDSQATLDWMLREFPNKVVHYNSDLITFEQNILNTAFVCDSYKNGEDVLIESLLLSKCKFLVRTISNVSGFSMVANPDMNSQLVDLAFYNDHHANKPDQYKNFDYWKQYYNKDLEPSSMQYHLEQSREFEKKKMQLYAAGQITKLNDHILEFYYGQ